MSIKDISEWDNLTPEERKMLAKKLIERYPSLFCRILKILGKCIYEIPKQSKKEDH